MFNRNGLAAALILAIYSAAPQAQTSVLEEVIVTATKRAESLQDVAVTVTAITGSTLQEAGVVDLTDIAKMVPTLTVATNVSPFSTALRIRGIGTGQNDVSLEASVAFILDGVYMARSGLGMSDLTDIERVEVLQGPQGTLYGKNSNAGVISVVTKNPNFEETEGSVQATVGDYNLQNYIGSVSGPVGDTLAYRVGGNWRKQDGWLENGTGPDQNSSEDWNIRGKLQWMPTDELSVMLTASYVHRNDRCCGSDATQTQTVLDLLAANGLAVPKNDAHDWKINLNQSSEFNMTSQSEVLTIDYDLGWAQLTSLTSWNEYKYNNYLDADRSEFDVLSFQDDRYTGTNLSQELRLTSDLDGPLQYLAGFFYMAEENTRGNGNPFLLLGEDILTVGTMTQGPQLNLVARPGDYIAGNNKWQADTWAAFGQTTYSFTDDWLLTLGLRYTREQKDADLITDTFSTSPAASIPGIPTFVELVSQDIDESFHNDEDGYTWLANLRYFVTPDIMVFAAAATGTKSGGFNGVSGTPEQRQFDEETTNNYELGVKSQLWDNRLKLNASAFYAIFDDYQFLAQLPEGIGQFVSNAAQVTTQGVEMNVSALPMPNLLLEGGLQYLDAQYTDGELDEQGLQVMLAPDWSGSLAATVMLPMADGTTYLRTDYSFMGDHYLNPNFQTPETKQNSHQINARVGWRNDSWDASLWAKNITDEANAGLALPFNLTGALSQYLEPPRTYGVTVKYSF
jgi:iron complex outermembrane receptor protein